MARQKARRESLAVRRTPPTLLRLRRAVAEGKIKPAVANKNPVLMGLQDERGFPHAGTVDFKHILIWGDRAIDILFNGPEWDHDKKCKTIET